jgi:hypothetical protein
VVDGVILFVLLGVLGYFMFQAYSMHRVSMEVSKKNTEE